MIEGKKNKKNSTFIIILCLFIRKTRHDIHTKTHKKRVVIGTDDSFKKGNPKCMLKNIGKDDTKIAPRQHIPYFNVFNFSNYQTFLLCRVYAQKFPFECLKNSKSTFVTSNISSVLLIK